MSAEPILVLVRLTGVLERLNIPYLIGGFFASSVFGTPRSTQDADVVAEITLSHQPRHSNRHCLGFRS